MSTLLLTALLFGGSGCPLSLAPTGIPLEERLAGPPAAEEPKEEVVWFRGSYETLMATAREKGQLVLLDFWTDW